MLTGTLLLPEDFDGVKLDKSTAQVLVRDLRENAFLITTSADIAKFEAILPTYEYSQLREAVTKGLIRTRARSSDRHEVERLSEVRVSPTGATSDPALWAATVLEYAENVLVEERQQIRNGTRHPSSRDEFWFHVIEPMLRAMPRNKAEVDLVDSYLFDDFYRYCRRANGANSGLFWLLNSLGRFADTHRTNVKVRIVTCLHDTSDHAIGTHSIRKELEAITASVTDLIELQALVVPHNRQGKEIRDATHHRRLVTSASNSTLMYLGLDRGVSDLDLLDDGTQCRASSIFTYVPHVAQGSERHNLAPVYQAVEGDHLLCFR